MDDLTAEEGTGTTKLHRNNKRNGNSKSGSSAFCSGPKTPSNNLQTGESFYIPPLMFTFIHQDNTHFHIT